MREAGGDRPSAERLRERAAICREVTPHWGRHNAASHLLKAGRSKQDAKRAGGWSTDIMLKRYEHLAPEANKDITNLLDFGRAVDAKRVQSKKNIA
jgi:site-specific recombinase XerD